MSEVSENKSAKLFHLITQNRKTEFHTMCLMRYIVGKTMQPKAAHSNPLENQMTAIYSM